MQWDHKHFLSIEDHMQNDCGTFSLTSSNLLECVLSSFTLICVYSANICHTLSARSIVLVNFVVWKVTPYFINCFSAFMGYFRTGVITNVTFIYYILFHLGFCHRGLADFFPAMPFFNLSLQAKIYLID